MPSSAGSPDTTLATMLWSVRSVAALWVDTLPNNTHNSRLSSNPHTVRQQRRNKKSPA